MTQPDADFLLETWIDNPALRHHCRMVSAAMHAYADKLGKDAETRHQWGLAGLLHDLDWEKHPQEHPTYALTQILPGRGLWDEVLEAIKAHAPERTGKHPDTEIERYLFACDELSGFMHAVSWMRPEGFVGMSAKSVTKKLKDPKFAAAVSRDDIRLGAELIGSELDAHILFLAGVFTSD